MKSERRLAKLESVIRHRQPDLTVILENIHDPHNVSAILRSCDAAGVVEVQLVYTVEEFPRLGKKSSASATKWVDHRKFKSVKECFDKLHKEGYTIYATHLSKRTAPLYKLDLTKRVALAFGNEHRGVSEDAASLADGNFQIPMFGMIQSLNVSVACAVSLFEAVRQRMSAGRYDGSPLDDTSVKKLLKQWAMK
ncbi:MAG TPA: RNA methyltransferase [Bacteroidota bacterium]